MLSQIGELLEHNGDERHDDDDRLFQLASEELVDERFTAARFGGVDDAAPGMRGLGNFF